MSDTAETAEIEAPRRGRPPRARVNAESRRRRNSGSLNRMTQMRLDIFPQEILDPAYVYRWVDTRPGRIHMATKMDDYDFVGAEELGDHFNAMETDSESEGRVRMLVEEHAGRPVYSYLCKKRRDYWESDQDEIVRKREDMMAGRVYRGESGADFEGDGVPSGHDLEEGVAYVPKGVQMGGPSARKRPATSFR